MAPSSASWTSNPPAPRRVYSLENGDRLTREEFERRWQTMPHLK